MTINAGQSVVFDGVAGAVTYDFELKNSSLSVDLAEFTDLEEPVIEAAELLADQPHGNYYTRCRANDNAGPGAWSELLSLEFTALPAPQNGRVE